MKIQDTHYVEIVKTGNTYSIFELPPGSLDIERIGERPTEKLARDLIQAEFPNSVIVTPQRFEQIFQNRLNNFINKPL